ncbi:MAG: AMP-binding protein [Solirubrobacterales bacterium]
MVVEGWLERAAAAAPELLAVETPEGSLSYAQLLARARAGAGELAQCGVGPGARVAIALPPGLAFAQSLHACLLAGAVAVPVDLRLSAAEREHVAAGAALVIEEPLGEGSAVDGSPASAHDLTRVAVVIHTSGTTAAPRPVELTYGNFLWSALGSAVALGLDPRERWLCALPLSHVGGLSILVRSAIYATTAVIHERFETERVLAALREQGITLVSLVATTLARLLDAGLEGGAGGRRPAGRNGDSRRRRVSPGFGRAPRNSQSRRPTALRCALTGGGPVPPALLARAAAAGVPVSQTYGLTESCSQVTTTPLAAIGDAQTGWAGTPLFCTRLSVGADAEIMVAGPTVAPGSLDEDGWLHTGDLGRLDENGRLRVTGRASDTIVSGGENIAPTEVEAVLEAHPDVLEAAVVSRLDPQWGEAVTAIVVGREGVELAEETLRAHCAASLAPYKVPKQIVLAIEPLPRTRSGKLLRRELV